MAFEFSRRKETHGGRVREWDGKINTGITQRRKKIEL